MYSNKTSLLSHQRIFESLSLLVLIVVSSFLNIATCVIIAKDKLLRNRPANVFVANLCLSNMVLTLFVIPFSITTLVRGEHGAYKGTPCTVNGFLSVTGCSAIVMTLCSISIDRYIAVNKPTKYRSIITPRRAIYMISAIWLQALLYASLPLLGWSRYAYHPGTLHCSPAWMSNCSLYIFLSITGFAIPLVVMFVTYVRIFRVIRKHSRKIINKFAVASSATFQVQAVCNLTQEQDESPSDDLQNSSIDHPDATNGSALQNGPQIDSECQLTSSVIVTQDDNTSRFLKPDAFLLSNDNHLAPIYADAKPLQIYELPPSVLTDQPSTTENRNMRGIFVNIRSSLRSRKLDQRQLPIEYKIAKTGLLLLILFLLLWLPYIVVNACTTKVQVPESAFHVAMWLVYMNGVANPIAYAFKNRSVKTKFRQIFHKIFSFFPAFCCRQPM